MKKLWLFVVIVATFVGFCGCEKEPVEPRGGEGGEEEENSLLGTKWKLVGFFDIEKDTLIEPLAKDCEDCYTLNFNTESVITDEGTCYVASGTTVNVSFGIYYNIDYQISEYYVESIIFIHMDDKLDGYRYGSGIYYDSKFELKDNELKWYYTDRYNNETGKLDGTGKPFYLLFKRRNS